MFVTILVIQAVLIGYLFTSRAWQREQTIVLTHFVWSLYEGLRAEQPEEDAELFFQRFVGTAAEERLQFTWINPLRGFIRTKRLLFSDERHGRFGMHAYRAYFERVNVRYDGLTPEGAPTEH